MKIYITLLLFFIPYPMFSQESIHHLNFENYDSVNVYWNNERKKIKSASIKMMGYKHSNGNIQILKSFNPDGTISSAGWGFYYKFDSLFRLKTYNGVFVTKHDSISDTCGSAIHVQYKESEIIVNYIVHSEGDSTVSRMNTTYLYNEIGLLIKDSLNHQIDRNINNQIERRINNIDVKTYEYIFDEKGRIKIKKIHVDPFDTPSGFIPWAIEYIYEVNKVTKRYVRESPFSKYRKAFHDEITTFDSLEKTYLVLIIAYDEITKKEINTYESGYKLYDKYGNIIESSYYGNKEYRMAYTYDSYGNILSETWYKKRLGRYKKRPSAVLSYVYTYY